ncbi:dockerin type I domain-containing protein [Rhodopirellula europaea]|uniref:dockerin type I domain-containing protein n=3 Tax=Rhodopirellula TaxID=265488 RepID=UPI0030EF24F9
MLAATLNYPGQDVELQRTGELLRIVESSNNSSVLDELNISMIDDDRLEINAAAFRVDSDVNLAGNDLLVSAESIFVVNGGLLGADEVVLSASKQPDLVGDVLSDAVLRGLIATESQTIEVRNSRIDANQITVSANGITSTGWDELGAHQDGIAGELITQLEAIPQIGLSPVNPLPGQTSVSPLSGQAKIHNASAGITLSDAVLTSTGAIDINATAEADSSLNSIAVTGFNASGLPATVSVGFSHSTSSATIDVSGTTQIDAGGLVNIATDATSTAINVARNEANSRARSQDAAKVKTAINLSMAFTNETSTIDVGRDTTISSGAGVNINATGDVVNDVKATTAVFNDGTVGFSAAVGVDNAEVRSRVDGTIESTAATGSVVEFTGLDIFSGSDHLLLKNIPAANPIQAGDHLTYRGELPMPGLVDGEVYYAREVSLRSQSGDTIEQIVRLTRAQGIDLDTTSVDPDAVHSLTKLDVLTFDASDVSTASNGDGQIKMTLPEGVSSLVYLGPEAEDDDSDLPAGIIGLLQNQRYEAVQQGNQIKLRLPGETTFVDFSLPTGTTGTHGFRYDASVLSFNPKDEIDVEGDFITLPADHGLQTGDFLLYATDPTRSVTREMYAFDSSRVQVGSLGTTTIPDAPVDGLDTHHGYYAVVDPLYPNQLKLTGSLADALAAEVVDISNRPDTDHTLTRETGGGGINITASLTATNQAEAGVSLTQGEQPWSAVLSGVAMGRIENIGSAGLGFFESLRNSIQGNGVSEAIDLTDVESGATTESGSNQQGGIDAAGSFVVSVFDHDVHAIIGATAELTSESTIRLDADIVQRTRLGAIGESTRNALNEENENTKEFAVSAGYGRFQNEALAIVEDSFVDSEGTTQQAVLDARRLVSVDADVVYPFLGATDDGVNAAVTVEQFGLGSFQSLLDGTHGLAGLVNVYARTLADGGDDSLSLALGLMITNTTNNVVARVGEGAQIQTDDVLPSGNQAVHVNANLDTFSVGAGQMSAINLSVPGFAEAFNRAGKRNDGGVQDFLKDIADPLGVSGKNAAGGTMLLTLGDHTTVAEIADSAEIGRDAWTDNAIEVTAISDIYDLALVQTGTASSQFGFSAAIAASNIKTDTRASVGDGASLPGGDLTITVKDILDRVNILGAFLKGKQIGMGTSIGVNVIDQNVAAFIGRSNPQASDRKGSNVDLLSIDVDATADGDVLSWVISGGLQGVGSPAAKADAKQLGPVSLNVPVAINDVASASLAYVDSIDGDAASVSVNATSDIEVDAVVIGASISVQAGGGANAGKLNLAGAGAVGVNTVVANVATGLANSDLNTNELTVQANDNSVVSVDAGGVAITPSLSSQTRAALSFGVSVAINDVSGAVSASLSGSELFSTDGDYLIAAESNSKTSALAIAGAASATTGNGSFGGAGAATQNAVAKQTLATVDGDVEILDGSLTVNAIDTSDIVADAGGVGIGVTAGPGASIAGAVGISMAFNDIANVVDARLTGADIKASGPIVVQAKTDAASIKALTVAASAGVAGSAGIAASLAGAGAGSGNHVANQVNAAIISSFVDSSFNGTDEVTDGITVAAEDNTSIIADSIGAALAASLSGTTAVSVAVGISVSENVIANQTSATVVESFLFNSDADVSIQANQLATIEARSIAASLGVAGGNVGVGVSGAGASSTNTISNQTFAIVHSSTIDAVGNVNVLATDETNITASILAASVAVAGGATGVAASLGFATADNRFGDATTYSDDPMADRADGSARVVAIVNRSQVESDGDVNVRSDATGTITSTVLAASTAAAAGSIGASVAGSGATSTNVIEVEQIAAITDTVGRGIDAGGRVVVRATNELAPVALVEAATLAIAAGSYAGGVSVAVSDARSRQKSKLQPIVRRSSVNTGSFLRIEAYNRGDATARAHAGAVAIAASPAGLAIAGGGATAESELTTIVDMDLSDSSITGGGLVFETFSNGTADAQTEAIVIAAGLIGIGASGSTATSIASPVVTATIADSDLNVADVTLLIGEYTNAIANAAGLTISTGLAVGVSQASTQTDGQVSLLIDNPNNQFVADSFFAWAISGGSAAGGTEASEATAQGSAGGFLIGVDATITSMTSGRLADAHIANGTRMDVAGNFNLFAGSNAQQDARSLSVGSGLVAAGVTTSTVSNESKSRLRIGSDVELSAGRMALRAEAEDIGHAHTVAGAVGGVSGAVAIPTRNIDTEATITIGDGSNLNVEDLLVRSVTDSHFDATLLAAAGGLLSGGGGSLTNNVDVNSQIEIGDVTIMAESATITATNQVEKSNDQLLGTVDATTGGLIAGVGSVSTTNLTLRGGVTIAGDFSIDNVDKNNVNIAARNEINAIEQTTLRSGGIAAGGNNTSTIRTLVDDAIVTFTEDASLQTTGGVDVYAGGGGEIEIQSNSETFGGATVTAGVATIDITPRNRITLSTGSEIIAQRDVNLSAGTDTRFNQDEYNIRSRVDSFAGSLIPIDLMDATATLTQDNRITIDSGAAVRSGGDLRMHAEAFGDNNVIAQVKAVNWTTGVAGAIDGLLGAGGVEQFGGTADINTTGVVTVNGTAETGIVRTRILEITDVLRSAPGLDDDGDPLPETTDLFTVVLADRSTGDVTFEKRLLPVNSALDLALEQAETQLNLYSDNGTLRNFYQGEVNRLRDELAEQNLVETLTDSSGNTRLQRIVRNALTLEIDPVFAKAGRIDVRSGSFGQNGTLIAPGDARVEIINQTPTNLVLEGIEVTQDSGGVFFNGQQVGGGEGGDTEKEIIVDNRFIVETGSVHTWPNITVAASEPGRAGGITNLGGDILLRTLPTGAGSIIINAPVNGRTQQIIAGNSGTVVINLPELGSIYENNVEHAQLTDFLKNDPVHGNGTFNGIVPVETTRNNSRYSAYLNQTPDTPSLIGSSIFVSAQYINVNGLIQSGKPEYKLTITDATADEITALRQDNALSGLVTLTTVDSSDLLARYDVDRDRIVVEEQSVSGGFVDLTGHITNTRNGEIRVLSDYAKIHIDNQTDIDIEVKRLDVSRRGEGTVIIKDLSGASRENPNASIYQREGDVILANTSDGVETHANGSSFDYQPQNGLRYGWTIAEERLNRTTTRTATSSWLGLDFIAPDPDDVISRSTQLVGTPTITDAGPFFYVSNNNVGRYDYSERVLNVSQRNYTCCGRTETNWIGTKTYYNTFISVSGTRTLHTHTVEADRPIDIHFEGQTEGAILIESEGDVYIAGALINPSGATTIRSDGSVFQGGLEGVVGGVDIRLDTYGAIGTSDNPLRTDLNESPPFDLRSDRVAQVDGVDQVPTLTRIYEGMRVLFVSGPTERGDVGAVYRFEGETDELPLDAEDYTDTQRWAKVEVLPSLNVLTRDGHTFVHEINGDLSIDSIYATRLGLSNTDGDITLIADGDIVYGQSTVGNYFGTSIIGNSISLISENGSIGQLSNAEGGQDRPVFAAAGLNGNGDPSHAITASAAEDIYLAHNTNIIVNSIVAGGDVRIDIDDFGTLMDGNLTDIRDERAIEEVITKIWDDLQLTEGRGSTAKRNERIAALESSQTQSYNAYWDFRETQVEPAVYDPDHRVTLSLLERDFYENDAATITTIENSRTTQYHALHATWGPLGDSREDYSHKRTEGELAEIDSTMKVWTEEELLNLRSVEFLNVTDTEFVIEEPNIVGRTVTLNVHDGIGRYDNGATVDLREVDGQRPVITLDQQALITAAEPGDIVYLDRAPDEVIAYIIARDISYTGPSDSETPWEDLGYSVGDRVFLETNTRDTTDAGQFFEIERLDGANMILDLTGYEFDQLQDDNDRPILVAPVFTGSDVSDAPFLRVLRREDIDVNASERVIATSDRHIYLGSELDFPIDRVHAGMDGGRVQIKVAGSLSDVATDVAIPNIVGSRIVLESADNNIGTRSTPLRIDMDGMGSLIARAENEIVITEQSEGEENNDLRVDQVFSQTSTIQLQTDGAIVDANDNAVENLRADAIVLRAGTNIGSDANPIEIDMIGDGSLTATASGDIHITEVAGNLGIRQVLSSVGDVFLTADVSLLDTVDVADPYDPFSLDSATAIASLPAPDIIGRSIFLNANLGFIGNAGNELDIDSDYNPVAGELATLTTKSDQNTFINEVAGDLSLVSVITDQQTAFIAAIGGSIFPAMSGVESIRSGKVWLFARDDIGQSNNPIIASVDNVEGVATTGSVYLIASGDLTIGGVVNPPSSAEGEGTGGPSVPTRDRGSSGFEAGDRLSLRSTRTLTIAEGLQAESALSLRGDQALAIPAGVSVQTRDLLQFHSGTLTVFGTLSASEIRVLGTNGDDTIEFLPESSSVPFRVDAGAGDNTIVGVTLLDEVVSAPVSGGSTTRQTVTTKENVSQTPLNRFVDLFDTTPIIIMSDDRFEFVDGVLLLKPDGFLQHPQDNELELTITFQDATDSNLSATQVVTILTEVNENIWTNIDFTEDVNRSGEASALDALVIINQLNRQEDSSLPLFRRFDSDDPFYDVTGDGKITALDALRVINYLNRQTPASGEPEAPPQAIFAGPEPEFMADFASSAFWEEDELDIEIDLIAGDLTRPGLF